MDSPIQQRYLSLNDTAKYLGLSPKTLYVWAVSGEIPGYKLGRIWRFDRDELDSFVRRSQKTYTPSKGSESGRKEA